MKPKFRMIMMVLTAALVSVVITAETDAAGIADLPNVVARVDGKNVMRSIVVFIPGEPIADAVSRAVDAELINQAFVKEGLDKGADYQKELQWTRLRSPQIASIDNAVLANFYRRTVPELTAKPDPTQVTEEDIDAWMQGNTAILGSQTGEKARQKVRGFVAREHAGRADAEAMKMRLAKAKLQFNGVPIPQPVIDADVDAQLIRRVGSRVQQPATSIRDFIRETVIAKEAKRQGMAPNVIEADAKLVSDLLGGVVIEGASSSIAVDRHPNRLIPLISSLGNMMLADEARKKGIDKDPKYLEIPGATETEFASESMLRANLYYSKHGVDGAKVTAEELDALSVTVIHALFDNKRDGKQDYLRSYLQAAKLQAQKLGNPGLAEVSISEAELEGWYRALMRAIVNGEKKSLSNHLQDAKDKWQREGILKKLRTSAKIEYLAGTK
jgi:hypothetical protein